MGWMLIMLITMPTFLCVHISEPPPCSTPLSTESLWTLISKHQGCSVVGQQHVTQRAHKPQLCKSWAISVERGGGNKCWVQLQTDCVCPVVCIFRPEQMLVYHVCCDVIASPFVSWVDPHSPSNVKGSQEKGEWGGGRTRGGVGEKGDGYQGLYNKKRGGKWRKKRSYEQ